MQFRDFIRKALGSEGRIEVLLYLLKGGTPTSEREIARTLCMSHTSVNKIMKDFHDINIVIPLRVGDAHAWQINKTSYAYQAAINMEYLAKHPPIEDLKDRITEAFQGIEVRKVVIFGSLAEGRDNPSSDIDLFVVIGNNSKKKLLKERLNKLAETCMQLYGNILSPTIMTEKETKESGNKKLVEAAIKGISVI